MDIRIARSRLLQILAVAAVGMAAGSAVAQSQEYRRGYDQGYRDGLAARGGEGRTETRRESARIIILSARYGTRDMSCDATETIRNIAGWHRRVQFTVNNELCGDPDEGRRKRLLLEYRCGDGSRQRTESGEGGVISLNCD